MVLRKHILEGKELITYGFSEGAKRVKNVIYFQPVKYR